MKDTKQTISLEKTRYRRTVQAATVFLIPTIVLIVIFIIYPTIDTFIISGYKWNGISADRQFIGLDNWGKLIKDETFWKAFRNNLIIMICSLALQIPLGLLMATYVDAAGNKAKIFKTIWFLPYLMSAVAVAFLFRSVLSANGGLISAIATLVTGKNTPIELLGKAPHALFAVIGVMAWQFSPFYMVYFMAGYSNIDTSMYEAAIIDGAKRGQYIRYIALPLLGPVIKVACTMSLIGSLKYFDLIWSLTEGGPAGATELMATYMYKQTFQQFNTGYGSSVAAGMFILITAIALIFQKLFVVKEEY